MMQNTGADHVSDPVSHISISGIHGRKELEKRLASSPGQRMPDEPARVGRLVAGALIGAAVMYLLDPDRGPRRRSLVRDKFIRAGHSVSDRLGKLGRDIRNRAAGRVAETRGRFRSELVDDTILVDRVRSAVGHVVSHPGSIEVSATDGGITRRPEEFAACAKCTTISRFTKRPRACRDCRAQRFERSDDDFTR
jgi:hypothetical protein